MQLYRYIRPILLLLFMCKNNQYYYPTSLTRDDPEEARYYANPKKTAMTLFHVVSHFIYCELVL